MKKIADSAYSGLVVCVLLGVIALFFSPGSGAEFSESEDRVSFSPSAVVVENGSGFELDLMVNTSSQIRGWQADISFDPSKVHCTGLIHGDFLKDWMSQSGGTLFAIQPEIDNEAGKVTGINLAVLGGEAGGASGSGKLCSVQFTALAGVNAICRITPQNIVLCDHEGNNLDGVLVSDASVQTGDGDLTDVDIKVNLQGEARPAQGWGIPVTIKLHNKDENSGLQDYVLSTQTTRADGKAVARIKFIEPGTYDISLSSPHCLAIVKKDVVISAEYTLIDMGTLLEGDASGDNKINIQDFGKLAASYGKSSGQSGFDEDADFDRNGTVNIADFGLLAANYGKSGN